MKGQWMSAIAVVFLSVSGVAADHRIVNLTEDLHADYDVDLNNRGQLVWTTYPRPFSNPEWDGEIFFYDDGEIRQITDNLYSDGAPKLNERGQIVWMGEPVPRHSNVSNEIFFFDGSNTHQLIENIINDANPEINNHGQIVWQTTETYNPYTYIHFFDGTTTVQLISRPAFHQMPKINDAGQVVWYGKVGANDQIFLFDGADVVQLTDDQDQSQVELNENGQIVWTGFDGHDDEIFLYDDGVIQQITDNDYGDYAPKLNDHGQITWTGRTTGDAAGAEVFMYDGTEVLRITHNDRVDFAQGINNRGHIVMTGGPPGEYEAWQIYLFDGAIVTQITHDDRREVDVTINDLDQIAWAGFGPYADPDGFSGSDIFLATPIEPIDVVIDIKPGSDPNCFNNNGSGVIPVAVLGSESFDVARIEPATVRLATLSVRVTGKSGKLLASQEDVNGDGFVDLVVHIEDEDGVFEVGDASATLTGNLLPEFDAAPIRGTDSICVTQ